MALASEDGGEESGEEATGVDGEVENSKELWNEMFLEEASKGRGWGEAMGGWADRTLTLVQVGGVPSATAHSSSGTGQIRSVTVLHTHTANSNEGLASPVPP